MTLYNADSMWRISPGCKLVVSIVAPLGKLSFFIYSMRYMVWQLVLEMFCGSSKCLMKEHCFHDTDISMK